MSVSSRSLDRFATTFDHEGLVANAGLIVAATLMDRLGLLGLIERWVRTGSANPGRKILTLVAAMLAGATHIDHVEMLRAGGTGRVLGFTPMAPSTVGSFLRTFTFGHARQLEAVLARTLARAWGLGAGPGDKPLTVDLDSTICEVHGKHKGGAAYGYTKVLGYHPLPAARADTREVLAARMRKGSAGSARGVVRFVDELVANLRRAGATGPTTVRADSGFWSHKLIDRLDAHNVKWSITVALGSAVRAAIQAISDNAWADIAYTQGGRAQIAETQYVTGRGKHKRTVRLVVRRTRLAQDTQQQMWPDWRHHAFITNTDHDTAAADQFHRNRRRRRARHPRPQRRLRARPRPLRPLPRQLRMARLRNPRPQHRPLDRAPRRRAARHQPLPTHPTRRPRRRAGQPLRHTHPATPRPLALGNTIPHHTQSPASPSRTLRLNDTTRN